MVILCSSRSVGCVDLVKCRSVGCVNVVQWWTTGTWCSNAAVGQYDVLI